MAAGNTYTPIATYTVPSAQANYTFSSIPGTYTDLVLIINGAMSINNGGFYARLNGDTGTNYSETNLYGNGTTATSDRDSTASILYIAARSLSTTVGGTTMIMNLMNYSNTTTYKTVLLRENVTDSTYPGTSITTGLWRSTSAITTILLYCSGVATLSAGTTLSLYGILAA